jgi:hypothetical protein
MLQVLNADGTDGIDKDTTIDLTDEADFDNSGYAN